MLNGELTLLYPRGRYRAGTHTLSIRGLGRRSVSLPRRLKRVPRPLTLSELAAWELIQFDSRLQLTTSVNIRHLHRAAYIARCRTETSDGGTGQSRRACKILAACYFGIGPGMPCRYVIDKERRLVVSTASDCVTFAELKAHQEQLASDPDFTPDFNQLLDGTKATSLAVTIEQAKTLARRKVFSATSRRAFVAPSPAMFGIARVFEAYHSMSDVPSHVCVFYDLGEARKWLGLE